MTPRLSLMSIRTFTSTINRSAQPPRHTASAADLFASSASSSSSSSSATDATKTSSTAEAMRTMLNALARNRARTEEDDDRRKFFPSKVVAPVEFRNSVLYQRRPRPPRPPLLGPPKKLAIAGDPFHQTGTSPLDHAFNPVFISSFLDPMGRIKPRSETGLTQRSQRYVAKMVKRARSMGVIGRLNGRPARYGLGMRGEYI